MGGTSKLFLYNFSAVNIYESSFLMSVLEKQHVFFAHIFIKHLLGALYIIGLLFMNKEKKSVVVVVVVVAVV